MEASENSLQTIDLSVLLDDFLKEAKRLWFMAIILVVAFAAGLSAYRYYTFSPYYMATASFTVKVINPLHANIVGYNAAAA